MKPHLSQYFLLELFILQDYSTIVEVVCPSQRDYCFKVNILRILELTQQINLPLKPWTIIKVIFMCFENIFIYLNIFSIWF